jgi:membrane protease subunit HflC
VVYLDRRILTLDIPPLEVIASDQKRLIVDAFARWRIEEPKTFYRALKNEPRARDAMRSIMNTKLRNVLGNQVFSTLLSGERRALMQRIADQMNSEVARYGIKVVDVRIKRSDLPPANSKATFDRMNTERQQEAKEARAKGDEQAQGIRSRADREVIEIVAAAREDSDKIRGAGEAERNRIFAEAFGRDPEFFAFYRSMRAYENALKGENTTVVLSPDSEFFRYFGDVEGRGGVKRR